VTEESKEDDIIDDTP